MTHSPLPHDPVLVEVTRGGIVESFHRGAVAVVDADGASHTSEKTPAGRAS